MSEENGGEYIEEDHPEEDLISNQCFMAAPNLDERLKSPAVGRIPKTTRPFTSQRWLQIARSRDKSA